MSSSAACRLIARLTWRSSVGKTADHRDQTDGGDGEAPRAQVHPFRVVEPVDGCQGVLVIVERFAHAHDDHIGDDFIFFFN